MKKNIDYIIFILLLAFTTFEYFFREDKLFIILGLLSVVIALYRGNLRKYTAPSTIVLSVILLFWTTVQAAFTMNTYFTHILSLGITLLGAISIATIVKERFIKVFVTVMYYIAIIATAIYLLCIVPSIKTFIIDVVCPNFTSLNIEAAVFEGGGKNFIIHNFASDTILEATGLMRNCGPFWEPGMFAVFLNIALFLNVIVEKQKLRFCNFILIIALITTFSTGGFVSALLVLLSYVIVLRKNLFVSLAGIVVFAFIAYYVMNLEYVGEKTLNQIENTEDGTDISRFSAFITQSKMIRNSPILGGERIEDYLTGETKTLASGTLLPFVRYGIPVGSYLMITILLSFIRLVKSKGGGVVRGILLFATILLLSFSQTILLSSWMMVFMFVGLNSSNNKYYGRQI